MIKRAYVIGTCDTKGEEVVFVRDRLADAGIETLLVDIGIKSTGAGADVSPREVASHHPGGADAVMVNDRGRAVAGMAQALLRFIRTRDDIAAIIGLGGSGGTAMITPSMQSLPIGVPKIMVSAVAASDIRPYVGLSDLVMMPSVTDLDRVNRISRAILSNAVNGLVGMLTLPVASADEGRPAMGITTAGVTTECQQRVMDLLRDRYECLSFHAAGTGGPTMEKLAESGLLDGMIDLATTEVTDLLLGGAFACGSDRFDAAARSGIPYVGSCGALDCWKFRALETVPHEYRARTIYAHNPEVTLVRPDAEESARIGAWIGEKLNAYHGPVRFLLPRGGLSSIDGAGRPFFEPDANLALFAALEGAVRHSENRRLVSLPYHVNDPEFADALVTHMEELVG